MTVQTAPQGGKMTLAQTLSPHLPFLRRYARALTGDQKSGDAYVAATLEAIISSPALVTAQKDARLALYGVFHKIWTTAQLDEEADLLPRASWTELKAQERLRALTPLSRQALLLQTLEGFTASEAARILDRSEDDVTALLDEAMGEIDRQTHARVLIIEDEAVIAMDLSDIVQALGHEIAATAATAKAAVAAAERERPSLVLADIQLADGSSGIDAVNAILSSFSVPVIFITAFPERLLTGERPEPTFLITKPYSPDSVRAAVSQALFFESSAAANI